MLTELGERKDAYSEIFIKELENIKKNQSDVKNTITEMKNTLEEINSRLGDTEDLISNLVDGIMEITKSEWKKINE